MEREDSLWYPSARLFRQRRWGDWEEVFGRVAAALRKRARRPLPARVSIQVGLAELLERAVLAEIEHGSAAASWAQLRQVGLPETAEVGAMVGRLKAAHVALARARQEMEALACNGHGNDAADALVRHYVESRDEHGAALGMITKWLAGGDDTSTTVAESRRAAG